jgi:DNA-binding LacI/PurR family transcriptional regulator
VPVNRSEAVPVRPRIIDVAALAGVSRQTVSNVINGRGGFGDDTRAKVEAAIEALAFQPNRYAQSLRSRRTMLLGFDMSGVQLDVSNPFTVSFLRALVRAASTQGYRVVVFTHEEESAADFRSSVSAGTVDGFVLSDSPADDRRSRILAEADIPFVVFGRTAPDLPQCWVDIDNRQAMAAPVDHLLSAGHRTFGYIGYPNREYWNRHRYEGARARLQERGLDLDPDATITGSPPEVRPRLRELLQRPDRPTALITSSDTMAVQVVNTAAALGLRIGTDIAVTGFDAGPLRTMVEPTLTSVGIPVDRIAGALVDRLLKELRGQRSLRGEVLPTELVVGGSA